jgi:hypothetical protein
VTRELSEIATGDLQEFVSVRLKKVSAKTVCNEIVVIKEMFTGAPEAFMVTIALPPGR